MRGRASMLARAVDEVRSWGKTAARSSCSSKAGWGRRGKGGGKGKKPWTGSTSKERRKG